MTTTNMNFPSRLTEKLDPNLLEVLQDFLDSQGATFSPNRVNRRLAEKLHGLSWQLKEADLQGPTENLCLRFLIMAAAATGYVRPLAPVLCGEQAEEVLRCIGEIDPEFRPEPCDLACGLMSGGPLDWKMREPATPQEPFVGAVANFVWNLDDECLAKALQANMIPETPLCIALLRYKPHLLVAHLEFLKQDGGKTLWPYTWEDVLAESGQLDSYFLEVVKSESAKSLVADTSKADFAMDIVKVFVKFNTLREDAHLPLLLDIIARPEFAAIPEIVEVLAERCPEIALDRVAEGIAWKAPYLSGSEYEKLLERALEDPGGKGRTFLLALLRSRYGLDELREAARSSLLSATPDENRAPAIRALFLELADGLGSKERVEFWSEVASHPAPLFDGEFREFLTGSSKTLREVAARHLARNAPGESLELARKLIGAKKVNARLGAVALFGELGKTAIADLRAAHSSESSRKVHELIEQTITRLGAPLLATDAGGDASPSDLEKRLAGDKHLRAPKRGWLNLKGLVLTDDEGNAPSEKALWFLIGQQARHKLIEPAPAIVPLLARLPRERNSDVAMTLLKQWSASAQAASDRWVLTLAGLLGDQRVVPTITASVHRWCKDKRKELAECGVRALALLGTDEALMILDDIARRYRSKCMNVGRAAAEGFQAVADARGIGLEDLRDLVVPALGFDAGGTQPITSEGTAIHAVLQPDFSLRWRNPATGKETKNPPSKLPAGIKNAIKDLRRLLRDTVKSQTARLELALVCQRRWPVGRWRELFEDHALLSIFATRVVWGVYDAGHALRQTFRRYPNGILADAGGEMVELTDPDAVIGFVHPLELAEPDLAAWRSHLERHGVVPPFPQLERPIHRLDPLHANRRELAVCQGTSMAQGTLFSRSERLGWHRGSVVESGELASLYKPYPAAGIEVILELHDFFMGGGFDNYGTLGRALFVEPGTVKRGRYVSDDPAPDDPRVLPFGKIPPIVYSETISDLMAIIS